MIESDILRALHALHKECPKSDDDDVMMMMMMMTSAGKILSGENSKGLIFSGAHALFPGMCAENKRKKEIFAHFKEILKGSIQEPLKWSNFPVWDLVDCATKCQTLSTLCVR